VDFIDDVDLSGAERRRENNSVTEFANIINPSVRSSVYLNDVHWATLFHENTVLTLATGLRLGATESRQVRLLTTIKTVDGLGKDPSQSRLPSPARPSEEIGLAHPVESEGVSESSDDMLLANDIVESSGAVFTVEGGHR
jgi:hypothetical protein